MKENTRLIFMIFCLVVGLMLTFVSSETMIYGIFIQGMSVGFGVSTWKGFKVPKSEGGSTNGN